MPSPIPKLILTTGEPAGIGPDLIVMAASEHWDAHLIATGNRSLLETRARMLGLDIEFVPYSSTDPISKHHAGRLPLIDLPLSAPCTAGKTDPQNASYVLAQLDLAVSLCESKECQGMVTAPVHKAAINESGISFSGHTEYLAEATHTKQVVMLLATGDLRVALATTHVPLRSVPDAIDPANLESILTVLNQELAIRFGLDRPRITVLGLNPHAGEAGHLGREDLMVITPVCEALHRKGLAITGPVPADSAFIPEIRAKTDAYLAMYHDQGLPVLKALGFHGAVNITLGLPIVRSSVDHGTALDLAATGKADAGSLKAAIQAAIDLA